MTNYNQEQRIKKFNQTLKEKNLTMLSASYSTARDHYDFKCKTCGAIFNKVAHSVTTQEYPCPKCTVEAKAKRHRAKVQEKFLDRFKKLGLDHYYEVKTYPELAKNPAEFIHKACGNTIKTSLQNLSRTVKTGSTGCKYCSKTCTYTEEEIKEYFRTERPTYTFIRSYMNDKHHLHVVFVHNPCGKERDLQYNVLLRGQGCMYCKQSGGEETIAYTLDKLGVAYEQEKPFQGLVYKKELRVDFYIPSINTIIEYDGRHHYEKVDGWGDSDKLSRTQLTDSIKNDYARDKGITMVRVPYTIIGSELSKVIEDIVNQDSKADKFKV